MSDYKSEYHTIDPTECLSFFLGSWRELHLHEFEHSDTDYSDCDSSFSSLQSNKSNKIAKKKKQQQQQQNLQNTPKQKSKSKIKVSLSPDGGNSDDSSLDSDDSDHNKNMYNNNNRSKGKLQIPSDLFSPRKTLTKSKSASQDDTNANNSALIKAAKSQIAKTKQKNSSLSDDDCNYRGSNNSSLLLTKTPTKETKKKKIIIVRKKKKEKELSDSGLSDDSIGSTTKQKKGNTAGASSKHQQQTVPDDWLSPKKKIHSKSLTTTGTMLPSSTDESEELKLQQNDNELLLQRQTSAGRSKSSGPIMLSSSVPKIPAAAAPTTTTTAKDENSKLTVNQKKFIDIVNCVNPYNGEVLSPSQSKRLIALINNEPDLCKHKYTFSNAFPTELLYPLHILCAIAAPMSVIKKCYKNNPSASNDDSTQLGTSIHYACAFHYILQQQHSSTVGENDGSNIKKMDNTIDRHISGDSLKICQFLVFKNANALRILNRKNQQTALHVACRAPTFVIGGVGTNGGRSTSLTQKRNHNKDFEDTTDDDNDDEDLEKNELLADKWNEIVTYLTEVCPKLTQVVDREKNTPLHIACSGVSLLQQSSAKNNNQYPSKGIVKHLCTIAPQTCLGLNNTGSTPIHLILANTNHTKSDSILEEYVKVIRIVIKTNEIALRIMDQHGNLPIHITIQYKWESMKLYKLFIKTYPECTSIKTKNGIEPYMYAKQMELSNAIVKLLQQPS